MIPTGLTLDLPCRGTLTTASAPVETPAPAPTKTAEAEATTGAADQLVMVEVTPIAPAAEPAEIVIVEPTAVAAEPPTDTVGIDSLILVGFTDNLPYSDANLLHGGLITTLVETALLRSNAAKVDQPVFVTKPETGLATSVLPENFHLSFPWLQPDCKLGEFDADIRDLCENFTFSAPIYEAEMAMYSLSDGPFKDAAEEVDLVGARICRPAAMHTYDLLEDGMIEPIISLETATDLATCFDDLRNDIVDIVSVNGLTADVYFTDTGRADGIVELTALTATHTVHTITSNDNPEGLIAIEYLNAGLWDMLASGEWGEIAKDYLLNRLQ